MSKIPDVEEDEECAEVEGKAKCEVAEVLLVDMEITKVEAISFAGNNLTRKNLLDPGENIFVVSEEEKILPENEMAINIAHELVEDVLKTLFKQFGG